MSLFEEGGAFEEMGGGVGPQTWGEVYGGGALEGGSEVKNGCFVGSILVLGRGGARR